MAAIDEYLQQIMDAVYGEEVRGSIHDAIAAMNVESTAAEAAATSSQTSAAASASSAHVDAQRAESAADRAEQYAAGGVKYKGTIAFANVPTTGMQNGDMYNISDAFTADNKFRVEDRGKSCPAGTNIIFDGNINLWDIAGGTNVVINDMTGASSSTAGTHGLVPAPSAGDQDKFLKGSGTWHALPDMRGATATTAGSHGFVPAPAVGDQDKFLKGDGTWAEAQGGGSVVVDSEMSTSSTNPVQNRVITQAVGEKVSEKLLRDTVGYTGKNLLNIAKRTSSTINGVTFTINSDGTVTVNGTATATTYFKCFEEQIPVGSYTWTGCAANGSGSTYCTFCRRSTTSEAEYGYDYGAGATFTLTAAATIHYYITILNGYTANNLVFRPMIRYAENKDATFEKYHTNVEETKISWVDATKNVPKNLLCHSAKSQTYMGMQFTVMGDGSIVANGTATGNIYFTLFSKNDSAPQLEKGHTYILSGCPAGGAANTYKIYLHERNADNTAWATSYEDYGSGKTYTRTTDCAYSVLIYIASGVTMNYKTFYPMIRFANTSADYKQYIPNNTKLLSQASNRRLGVHNIMPKTGTSNQLASNGGGVITRTDGYHAFTVTTNTADFSGAYFSGNHAFKTFASGVGVNGLTLKISFSYKASDAVDGRVGVEFNLSTKIMPTEWTHYTEYIPYRADQDNYYNVGFYNMSGQADILIYVKDVCLTVADDTDDTYGPYALTNKQLTDEIKNMTGASASTAGSRGFVPAPAAGDQDKYLKGDGTWGEVQGSNVDLPMPPIMQAGTHYTKYQCLSYKTGTTRMVLCYDYIYAYSFPETIPWPENIDSLNIGDNFTMTGYATSAKTITKNYNFCISDAYIFYDNSNMSSSNKPLTGNIVRYRYGGAIRVTDTDTGSMGNAAVSKDCIKTLRSGQITETAYVVAPPSFGFIYVTARLTNDFSYAHSAVYYCLSTNFTSENIQYHKVASFISDGTSRVTVSAQNSGEQAGYIKLAPTSGYTIDYTVYGI